MNDSSFPVPVEVEQTPVQRPRAVASRRAWLHWALLLATLLTTLYCGLEFHVQFTANSVEELERLANPEAVLANPALLLYGLPFSLTLLAILLAHEMGHYWTCRRHGIDATLPYVIPAPPFLPLPPPIGWLIGRLADVAVPFTQMFYMPFNPFGTFGAVIRIRSAFDNRRHLFDVGVSGPLAGFVVIVPALVAGVWLSGEFVPIDPQGGALMAFGEPWLFKLAVGCFSKARKGATSPSIRSAGRPGSACWPPASTFCRSDNWTAGTWFTRCLERGSTAWSRSRLSPG